MKLNLNERVQVVLTPRGAEIWNANEAQYENVHYSKPNYKQAGDVLKESLWSLFQVFGKDIYMGCQVPFEGCEIVLDEKPTAVPVEGWYENTGIPALKPGTLINFLMRCEVEDENITNDSQPHIFSDLNWDLNMNGSEIAKWRLHNTN